MWVSSGLPYLTLIQYRCQIPSLAKHSKAQIIQIRLTLTGYTRFISIQFHKISIKRKAKKLKSNEKILTGDFWFLTSVFLFVLCSCIWFSVKQVAVYFKKVVINLPKLVMILTYFR